MPLQIETQPFQFNQNVTVLGSITAVSLSGNHYGDGSNLTGIYQGTDLKALSGKWQSTYVTVSSLSANWNTAYTIATTYSSASGSFATNTLLQSTSALLTPLTLTNTLTSQLLPTTIYQNATGNWQSTYITVSSLSANWNTAYSLVSGGIVSTLSLPQSANWNSTYLTVSSLSANWNLGYQSVSTINTLSLSSNLWNSVYSLINKTTATTFNVNNLNATGVVYLSAITNPDTITFTASSLYGDYNSNAITFNIGNGQFAYQAYFRSYGFTVNNAIYSYGYNNGINIGIDAGNYGALGYDPSGFLYISGDYGYIMSFEPYNGYVGVNTTTPNQPLTVSGNISSNSLIYDGTNNSSQWNTAYSLVSGGIVSTISLPQSANWNSTYITVSSLSANWNLGYQSVSTTNTLNISSQYWNSAYTLINTTTATVFNINSLSATGSLSANQLVFTNSSFGRKILLQSGVFDIYNNIGIEIGELRIAGGSALGNNKISFYIDGYTGNEKARINNSGLSVFGNVSSQTVVYDANGNSNQWNATYTTVQSNSGSWGGSSGPYTFLTATSSIRPLSGSNTASGNWSSVLGGVCNTASGTYSTVVNAFSSCSTAPFTFVGSGSGNCATACYAVVVGGVCNTSSGIYSFIGGGCGNTANGNRSMVNGNNNNACAGSSVVAGGAYNINRSTYGSILGGLANCINTNSSYAAIVGGRANVVANCYSLIGGGWGNFNPLRNSQIVGGVANYTGGYPSLSVATAGLSGNGTCTQFNFGSNRTSCFSTAGATNLVSVYYSTAANPLSAGCFATGCIISNSGNCLIVAGAGDFSSATCAFVYDRTLNQVSWDAFIGGGKLNTSSAAYSFIGGGFNNAINTYGCPSLYYSTIVGGFSNKIEAGAFPNSNNQCSNFIGGGQNNSICQVSNIIFGNSIVGGGGNFMGGKCYNFIGGGCSNSMGNFLAGPSSIVGGANNCINGASPSSIVGGCINCIIGANFSSIVGGFKNTTSGLYSFVASGFGNCAVGCYSSIINGSNNIASGCYSFVAGGSANDTKGFANTFILGTGLSANQANFTYVNNLSSQGVVTANPLRVGNAATTTTVTTVAYSMQVYDAAGNSLGYIPIYSSRA